MTGRVFAVSAAGDDISGFDPARDRFDFGAVSVHNLILGKLSSGEVAFVNPWASTPEYQVVRGITYRDLTMANFGIVQNEHLRQDIGGAVSWEQGVGPRSAGTVYVRSHEYGVQERIEGFDPATMKLSFLYFGTRERLSLTDTAEGLLISVQPTNQSVLLAGMTKARLVPANVEFHHDQIVEDQLEVPFGHPAEHFTLVSRMALLTPAAPAGEVTDGHQTSIGAMPPGGHE
ncbi:MAG: 1,3-beta-glucanase, partial [Planctomycetia bacterium]|nr:1,3-beta-glucanase [Planctomycetia bacterium]